MKAQNKITNEIVNVQYGPNGRGNMRLWINGRFLTDKQFSRSWIMISQDATQN